MILNNIIERIVAFYPMRAIMVPICLSIGILIYYNFSAEPSWFQILFYIPSLIIFHFIRKELAYVVGLILLGVIAFKLRVDFINYKPSQVTTATMILQATIQDIRVKQYEDKESWKMIIANIHHIPTGNQLNYTQTLPKKAILNVDQEMFNNATAGSIVEFKARLMPFQLPSVPGGYDPRFYAFFDNLGSSGKVIEPLTIIAQDKISWRTYFQESIKKSLGKNSDFVLATMLGDKLSFKQDVLDDFAQIGLGHVLAISGLHIGIMSVFGFFLGKLLFWLTGFYYPRSWSHMLFGAKAVSLLCVLGYLWLSGMGFSALRSSLMFVLGLLLFYTQRKSQLIFTLITASTLILLFFPESLFYASFQLSVMAVFGFCLISYKKELSKIGKIKQGIITTLIISLLTLPLVIYHFGQISLQPFLANLLLLPYISIVIIPTVFVWFIQHLIMPIDFLSGILEYMIESVKYLAHLMSAFAFNMNATKLSAWSVIIYSFTILFWVTPLRYISYVGILITALSVFFPADKPVLLADNYGRIGFIKDEVMYVSWEPDADKFIQKVWQEYWQAKEVKRFNSTDSIFHKIQSYRVVADVEWELGNKRIAWCAKECSVNAYLGFGSVLGASHTYVFAQLANNGGVAMYSNGDLVGYQQILDRPWLNKYNVLRPI